MIFSRRASLLFPVSYVFVLVLFASVNSLRAQVECTGPECESRIPSFESFLTDFESLYLTAAFRDIAASHSLANLAALPGQGINLKRYALGAGLSAGYTTRRDIALHDQDGAPVLLPEMGVALSSGFHAGLNLGWAFSFWYNLFKDGHCALGERDSPCEEQYTRVPILSRLDLYASGVRGFASGNNPGLESARGIYGSHSRVDSGGYGMRVHLLEKRNLLSGFLIFSGLSLGFNVQKSVQGFSLHTRDLLEGRLGLPAVLSPDSGFEFDVDSEMNTGAADLRTGFNFLTFVHLGLALGVSRHSGRMRIRAVGRLRDGDREILLRVERFQRTTFKMNYAQLIVGLGGLYIQSTMPVGEWRGPGDARAVSIFYVLHY